MALVEKTTKTYVCDRCGTTSDQPFFANGKVRLRFDLHDYQGAAVAGFDREFDLCRACLTDIRAAILRKT